MKPDMRHSSRRRFVHDVGLTALGVTLLSSFGKDSNAPQDPLQRIKKAKAEGKLGIALVGLGNYAGGQLAPALQQTEHCYLAGIVSGTPSKLYSWKRRYNIAD